MTRPIRVLAIDGGGIRGIIPALALVELERLADSARAAELFDLIVGTSTGGIIALGLTVPGRHGRPPASRRRSAAMRESTSARGYGAKDLLDVYVQRGSDIFPGGGRPTWRQRLLGPSGGRHLGRDLWSAAQRVGGVFGGNPRFAGNARYFSTGLEQVLTSKFGDATLGAAVTPVAVTAYDMRGGAPSCFAAGRSPAARGRGCETSPEPRLGPDVLPAAGTQGQRRRCRPCRRRPCREQPGAHRLRRRAAPVPSARVRGGVPRHRRQDLAQ